ncbi:MAG: hypothetical protein ACTSYB_07795, partial [Candidatus Helarchaeota archaeon]
MKKVLMVCYEFTPILSPGTIRYSQFAKYLPEFGWEPIILTVKNPSRFYYLDHSIQKFINLKIYRSIEFPTIYIWKFFLKYFKKSFFSFPLIGWFPHTLFKAYR